MPHFTFWELLKIFFTAEGLFLEQWEMYEEKVLAYSSQREQAREDLWLNVEEVAELLDFKALETLRDSILVSLKEMSHSLFRNLDSTDSFDRFVTNIFHEVSILKEEHYSLKSFGLDPGDDNGSEQSLLQEAHVFFPRRVNKIKDLFEKARHRIEQLLPQQAGDRILIRSVYLFGETVLNRFYGDDLKVFYEKMYLDGGAAQGYYQAGKSFFDSGFYDLAEEALQKSLDHLGNGAPQSEPMKTEIDHMMRDIKIHST